MRRSRRSSGGTSASPDSVAAEPVRALFLGQKPLGERCFDILREAGPEAVQVCGVVSNAETGVWWGTKRVHEIATAEGIPFVSNDERNTEAILDLVRAERVDTLLSVQHAWILPSSVLQAVDQRALNLHMARLPDYKGYNTFSHAILNGDSTYTSTIHWMVEEVDAGGIAFEETFDIAPEETARSLYEKATEAGLRAFRRLVEHLAEGAPIPSAPRPGPGTFYARESLEGLREIADPGNPDEVQRKARAFWFPPFEPAYINAGGHRYHVLPPGASTAQ